MQLNQTGGTQIEETNLVLEWLVSASKRIDSMRSESRLRDAARIWETYCDVEMAIALMKFIGTQKIRSGTIRRLKQSGSSDPSMNKDEDLDRTFALIESEIRRSKKNLLEGRGEESVEHARKARDSLKEMLLGRRRNSFKKK